jgi:hypothetical protein
MSAHSSAKRKMRINSDSDEEDSPHATPTASRRRLFKKSSLTLAAPDDVLHTPTRQRKAVVKIPSTKRSRKTTIVVSSSSSSSEAGSVIEVDSDTSDEYAVGTPLGPPLKTRLIWCVNCGEVLSFPPNVGSLPR